MRNHLILPSLLVLALLTACSGNDKPAPQEPARDIASGEIWPDNRGEHINAHGGGVMYYQDTYYWFGEHKADSTSSAYVGVTCYSSKNLTDWKYEGVALSVSDEVGNDIERGCVLERPKVIHCAKTGKFVMWFHLELKGQGYAQARYGVAVSDTPTGPYSFLHSDRVNAGIYPLEMDADDVAAVEAINPKSVEKWWTPTWYKAIDDGLFVVRDAKAHSDGRFDLPAGQMARDQTVYVDTDGRAYHIFASEDNLTLHIAELTDDYTAHSGRYTRVAPAGHNEAPAIFRRGNTYWMITSGCTGWTPNEARMFSAPSIWGPWKQHPNPCRGPKAELTFMGQSTYVLPVAGKDDAFIFMADIWRPKHPSDARYIWLPIQFENDVPVIHWMDKWNLDFFDKK
jgi:hypothetical protein